MAAEARKTATESSATADGYIGKVLTSDRYSPALQTRVRQLIDGYAAMEGSLPRVIPYISIWKDDTRTIWYEYVGRRLAELFACPPAKVAERLRKSIIDRRTYRYSPMEASILEEIIPQQQLSGHRQGLRREVKQSGMVEAVYKVALPQDDVVWFKDWAVTEHFAVDGLNLSYGSLTTVTKEMDHKEILEQIGYFDELTKLPKRNIMQRIMEINLGQMERGHLRDFVFLMMDIDHFKEINDRHGHQAGDHILAALAEVMGAVKRKEDEIGRYAGEEFYGISHGGIDSGRRFAERLRRVIAETEFVYAGIRIPVTISIGVAAASELPELSAEQLIMQADRRLYDAKVAGRNQVVWRSREGQW